MAQCGRQPFAGRAREALLVPPPDGDTRPRGSDQLMRTAPCTGRLLRLSKARTTADMREGVAVTLKIDLSLRAGVYVRRIGFQGSGKRKTGKQVTYIVSRVEGN